MRNIIFKSLLYFALGFTSLFFLRVIYGYLAYPNSGSTTTVNSRFVNTFEFAVKNYASEKKKFSKASGSQTINRSVDQKYEKVASMGTNSNKFTDDETKVRQSIKDFDALIQFEQSSGLPGARYLHLAIGVDPEKFDNMTAHLKNIGQLQNIRIDKTDKTSEYKDLQAQRESLEKILTNLTSLKKQGGKIDEMMQLEAKILEVEKNIQNLGLSLGEFDEENEFCTIKFSLQEVKKISNKIPFSQRLKVAFDWTVRTYFYLLGGLLFMVFVLTLFTFIGRMLAPLVSKYWNS